jgi:MFS family permease
MTRPPGEPAPVAAWRPWAMWGPPALLFLVAFFHRVAPGVVAKDLMQAFGASGAMVGLLSATYFYAYAGLMVPAGLLLDAFGARRVVAAGGAVMGAGAIVMAQVSTEAWLFAGRLLVGSGAAATFVGALKVAATWFPPSRFATISAVTATMGVLGSLAATVPLAALAALAGWRGAFAVVGLATLLGAGASWLVVRDRPAGAAQERAPGLRAVTAGMVQVLRNRHTWPPFLAFFCLYAAMGNLMLWVVPYLRDVYALTTTAAALYATAGSLALLVAGPLTGFLSDQVFRRRRLPYTVLTAALFVCWTVFVATLGALPLGALYALFFVMGMVSGAFVLTWPIGREVNPPALAGVAVAVVNLGGFLGAAITQGPLGALLDAGWAGVLVEGARVYPVTAYQSAFGICALLVLGAIGATLAMRETRAENIWETLERERRARPRPGRTRPAGPSAGS